MDEKYLLIGAGVLGLFLVAKTGAACTVGHAVGGAVVDAVGGGVTGVVDAISEGVGIPTTNETITDVQACKRFMDEHGVWAASFQCGAPAFVGALTA